MAVSVIAPVRTIGGARVSSDVPQVPSKPGVLILMNHQSLMDIPIVVRACRPGHPRIVTRARYAKGKPLISHMLKLYQYPLVEPRATGREGLEVLARQAAESPGPLAIYPEGTRTKDGSIGRFKRSGMRAILTARQWEVWMITIDGYWQCAKLQDFRSSVSEIEGKVRVDGPFHAPAPDAPDEEVDAFIVSMQETMTANLASLREAGAA